MVENEETKDYLRTHYKEIQHKTKSQGHFYITRSEGFNPRWAVFLEEPEMDVYDDGMIFWICPNDKEFWCGIDVDPTQLLDYKESFNDYTRYDAKVTKVYKNLSEVVQKRNLQFCFEVQEINGVKKLYAKIIPIENMNTDITKNFPSAEEAHKEMDKANSLNPHPLCLKELEGVLPLIKESYDSGVDGVEIGTTLRLDTIKFLEEKGYVVTSLDVPTLGGFGKKIVGHRISW